MFCPVPTTALSVFVGLLYSEYWPKVVRLLPKFCINSYPLLASSQHVSATSDVSILRAGLAEKKQLVFKTCFKQAFFFTCFFLCFFSIWAEFNKLSDTRVSCRHCLITLPPHHVAAKLKLIALIPSSAGLERAFSTMGFIHSDLRNKLGPEKVGKLAFCMRLLKDN